MSLIHMASTHSRIYARRRSLWIADIPLALLVTLLAAISPVSPGLMVPQGLVFTAQELAMFVSLAYAAAFADLMTGARQLGMDELESTSVVSKPVVRGARILGAWAIATMPSLVILLIIAAWQTVHGSLMALPVVVATYLLIVTPAALIAMGISALFGALMPTAPARIIAVIVWAWMVFSTPLLPVATPSGSVFAMNGDPIAQGWLGAEPIYQPSGGAFTPAQAGMSLACSEPAWAQRID